ncbi:protein mono-ADP-ribosyltransferase PARP6-like [Amphiura filiformis]|uniref:protein mono-ADP-ribosyltransferase PARP6-like n=1 Tax=Amphiura filiformis TaxID=82378 RepID=UPI003B228923
MSYRQPLLQADIRSVIQACQSDPKSPFQDLNFESLESRLNFTCVCDQHGDVSQVILYSLTFADNYPDDSMLTSSLCPNAPKAVNQRIPDIFNKLAYKHGHHLDLPLPEVDVDGLILDKGGGDNTKRLNSHSNSASSQQQTSNLPDVVKSSAMNQQNKCDLETGELNIENNSPFQQTLPALCDGGSDGLMCDPEVCAAKRRNIDRGDVDNRLNSQMEIHETADNIQCPAVHDAGDTNLTDISDNTSDVNHEHNTVLRAPPSDEISNICGDLKITTNSEDNHEGVMIESVDNKITEAGDGNTSEETVNKLSDSQQDEEEEEEDMEEEEVDEMSTSPSLTAISESHASRDSDGFDMDVEKGVTEDFPYADKDMQEDEAESSDLDDDDDYYASEDDFDLEEAFVSEDEVVEMNQLLRHDMEQVGKHYGPDAVTCRTFDTLGDIDVELHIDVSFLEEEISKAWCIDRTESLTCRLHCSLNKYLDANLPKVEVFQKSKQGPSGICSQVRKIAETFLLQHWKGISNDSVQSQLKTVPVSPAKSPSNNKRLMQDASVARLVDMGFGVEAACGALNLSKGLVDEAAHLLCTQPELCTSPTAQGSSGSKFVKRLFSRKSTSPNNQVPQSSPPAPSSPDYTGPLMSVGADLHLIPAVTQNGKNAKVVPTLEYGFLHQIYTFLRNRVPTLSEFCVVCDEQHIFQNGAMLKPAVCERELCVFSFQTLGVMQDAAENIATGAEVVDLMVAMVASSIKSHRRHLIFDPYPMVVDPRNPKEFAFTPKKKNYERIQQAVDSFISIREMLAAGNSCDVKKKMDHADVLAYPLLQWIISSNRSHIVKLPESRQIKFMHTAHQFLLLSSPPAKEALFRKAKQTYGSVFAFHGSHIENWHSILRHGLINASGTKHQMHGAVYGKGIYLSPHSSVSFGYSGMGHGVHTKIKKQLSVQSGHHNKNIVPRELGPGENRFLQSKNLTCIALCEVIKSKDLTKHGHVWVCTNPDHVCTRFFFVYEDGKVGDQGVDTTQERYAKEILVAMADCKAP